MFFAEWMHMHIDVLLQQYAILYKYKKVLLYFVFGITAASIDLGLYVILFNVLHVTSIMSTLISMSCAMFVGFFLNAYVNFSVCDRVALRFISYAIVSFFGMSMSSGFLYVFVHQYGFDGNVVKVMSMPPIFAMQYMLNCAISFRHAQRISRQEHCIYHG